MRFIPRVLVPVSARIADAGTSFAFTMSNGVESGPLIGVQKGPLWLIFDSWRGLAVRKLLILLVRGADISNM